MILVRRFIYLQVTIAIRVRKLTSLDLSIGVILPSYFLSWMPNNLLLHHRSNKITDENKDTKETQFIYRVSP